MKKKMIVFGALLMATIMTGFSVSGTYAKYISEGGYADDARVAKWGITIGGDLETDVDLFKTSYNSNAIKSDVDVIAPGAYGKYEFQYSINGSPEVKFSLTATVSVTDETGKLKFALIKQGEEGDFSEGDISKYTISDVSSLETALKQALTGEESGSKTFEAGSDAESSFTELNKKYTLYWMWDFNDKDDVKDSTNQTDTQYGNEGTKQATVSVKLTAKQLQA